MTVRIGASYVTLREVGAISRMVGGSGELHRR
jgi:hypothetical protein